MPCCLLHSVAFLFIPNWKDVNWFGEAVSLLFVMNEKVLIKVQTLLFICILYCNFVYMEKDFFYKKRKYLFWLSVFLVYGVCLGHIFFIF